MTNTYGKSIIFLSAVLFGNKHFLILHVTKELSEGVNKIFVRKKFHRGIRNKKLVKVKKFQVWVTLRFFE